MADSRGKYRKGDEPVPGYKLIEFLGEGQFGQVWKASAPGGLVRALKIIDLHGAGGRREFLALEKVKNLNHPNLVALLGIWLKSEDGQVLGDFSQLALNTSSDTRPAAGGASAIRATVQLYDSPRASGSGPAELLYAMGLGSKSLFRRLQECNAAGLAGIPIEELLPYMEDAAKGIDFLNQPVHETADGIGPIIHGDIKPHNLLVVSGSVQICDFGLCREVESLRKTTSGFGTCAYAAPELLFGPGPAGTSDQYCLAISYIEMRTGHLPYTSTNSFEVAEIHRSGKLDYSRLPESEREVLRRATDVDPAKRWPSCKQMVRELELCCRDAATGLPFVRLTDSAKLALPTAGVEPPGTLPDDATVTQPYFSPARKKPRSAWRGWVAGAVAVAVFAGAALLYGLLAGRDRDRDKTEGGDEKTPVVTQAPKDWDRKFQPLLAAPDYAAAIALLNASGDELAADTKRSKWDAVRTKWSADFQLPLQQSDYDSCVVVLEKLPVDTVADVEQKDLTAQAKEAARLTAQEQWTEQFTVLVGRDQYDKALDFLEASPAELIGPGAKKDSMLRLVERCRTVFQGLLTLDKLHDAEAFLDGLPPRAADVFAAPSRRAEVTQRWQTRLKSLIAREQFAAATSWIDKPPKSVDAAAKSAAEKELGEQWLAALEAAWRKEGADAEELQRQSAALLSFAPQCVPAALIRAAAWIRLGARDEAAAALTALEKPDAVDKRFQPCLATLRLIHVHNGPSSTSEELTRFAAALEVQLGAVPAGERWAPGPWESEQLRSICGAVLDDLLARQIPRSLDAGAPETRSLFDLARALLAHFAENDPRRVRLDELLQRQALAGIVADVRNAKTPQQATLALDALQQKLPLRKADAWPPELTATLTRELVGALGQIGRADPLPAEAVPSLERAVPIVEAACQRFPVERKMVAELGGLWTRLTAAHARFPGTMADAARAEELQRATESLQRAAKSFLNDAEITAHLAALWRARIALRIVAAQAPDKAEFERTVAAWHGTGLSDPLLDLWCAECLLNIGNGDATAIDKTLRAAAEVDVSKAGLTTELTAYASAVQARVFDKRDEKPQDGLQAIVRALPDGKPLAGPLAVQARLSHLADLATKHAKSPRWRNARLSPADRVSDLLGDDTSGAAYYPALLAVYQAGKEERLDAAQLRQVATDLALCGACAPRGDTALIRTLSAELVRANADLGADEPLLRAVCVKCRRPDPQAALTAADRQLVIAQGAALLDLLNPDHDGTRSGDLTKEQAERLRQRLWEPVCAAADEAAAAVLKSQTPPPAAADLERCYAAAAAFVTKHKNVLPAGKNRIAELTQLWSKAIDLHIKTHGAAATANDKEQLADYYVRRGKARAEDATPDHRLMLDDATESLKLAGTSHGAFGLRAHALLLQSRERPTREKRLAELDQVIEAGKQAKRLCPAGHAELPAYLINLSSACVEKANFERDLTYKKQEETLKAGVGYAEEAARQSRDGSDYPFLALGNLYEDLAWLVEFEPETNYNRAIAAFKKAAEQKLVPSTAWCSIGRCYFKAIAHTNLKPTALEGVASADEALVKSEEALLHAKKLDEHCVEAWFYLGQLHQLRLYNLQRDGAPAEALLAQWQKTDEFFNQAQLRAKQQNSPHALVYLSTWARFALDHPRDTSAAAARIKLLTGMPRPPGGTVTAAVEQASIEADLLMREKKFDEALAVLGRAIPAPTTELDWSYVNLFLARAKCRLALQPRQAAEALVDAQWAAELATFRSTLATAYSLAAIARIEDFKASNSTKAELLDGAIDALRTAVRLAPRRPYSGPNEGRYGLVQALTAKLLATKEPKMRQALKAEALQVLQELIDLSDGALRDRLKTDLTQLEKL